jgi:ferredoxin
VSVVRVRIDEERCEGHGRCYALAPELFEPDEIGNGRVLGDGAVPAGLEEKARLAAANCPELAVLIDGGVNGPVDGAVEAG